MQKSASPCSSRSATLAEKPKRTRKEIHTPPTNPSSTSSELSSWESLRSGDLHLPPLNENETHKIFFDISKNTGPARTLYPATYVDKTDSNFVCMPCSSRCDCYPAKHHEYSHFGRWQKIEKALRQPISTSKALQDAISSYNPKWNINVLHHLCDENLLPMPVSEFFNATLPSMIELALDLPKLVTRPIPLLHRGRECSLTFSQLQVASLLANAFFCTFPHRNGVYENGARSFPRMNFSTLLSFHSIAVQDKTFRCQREKVRCLLHYFQRITRVTPTGTVTYTRRRLGNRIPSWATSTRSFDHLQVFVSPTGVIDDSGINTIQVDFADKYLGGRTLTTDCVQEEIMFATRPELLVGCLFMECLDADETVIIEGTERYSILSGYGKNIVWNGDFVEAGTNGSRDAWGRYKSTVLAMDAKSFSRARSRQYEPAAIVREVNKAYCGFTDKLAPYRQLPSLISTGNWGCGVFCGNVGLKTLIQFMACCQAEKSLLYFTFGDEKLSGQLRDIHEFLSRNKITVGALWNVITTLDRTYRWDAYELLDYVKICLTPSSDAIS